MVGSLLLPRIKLAGKRPALKVFNWLPVMPLPAMAFSGLVSRFVSRPVQSSGLLLVLVILVVLVVVVSSTCLVWVVTGSALET